MCFIGQVRAVRRDNGEKTDISRVFLVEQNLFDVAKQKRDACIEVVKTWDEFIKALGQKKLILAPWYDEEEVEKDVKARTRGEMGVAKILYNVAIKYWLFTIYRTPNFFMWFMLCSNLCFIFHYYDSAWLILLYACLILHPSKSRVRHRLRKDHGIEGGIRVVFSLEKPKAQLLPFRGPSVEEDNPSDYQWGNSSNILKQNLK
ncbi:hypothetical protein ES288_D09G196300v1 [Gossypium darwinii]|uniref:Proline-tRNA ligase class II C-terminal domain-containing protein n=1 Tax=Gossypium darwinii TaxID=34276 RepID=A0A5D2BAZ0_GOSDA|nr:hypothetical protein ES288_D09G196300v1 [Gossypium darwinii]